MATVKGVNRTIADATTVSHTLQPGLFGGVVRCMIDTYELDSTVSGTVIEMGGELPEGAQVLAVLLVHDAMGSSVTMDVGDAEDVDRYLDGVDVSSAGSSWSNLADGVEYEIDMTTASTPDNQVLITTGGATGSGTVKLLTLYTND